MKKRFLLAAALTTATLSLVACDDNNDGGPYTPPPTTPTKLSTFVTNLFAATPDGTGSGATAVAGATPTDINSIIALIDSTSEDPTEYNSLIR